jgi:hypothetical protein
MTLQFQEGILQQMRDHIAADEILAGQYWKDGKGCFIGCIVHGESAETVQDLTGLPLPLVRVSETIFEGLSHHDPSKGRAFFVAITDCMERNQGKDISYVVWAFLHNTIDRALALPTSTSIRDACSPVLNVLKKRISGKTTETSDAAAHAANAARAAAHAANAARAAANAANAANAAANAANAANAAAYSANAANAAAYAAAYSADAAAYSAYAAAYSADADEYSRQAADLIRLIDWATPSTISRG